MTGDDARIVPSKVICRGRLQTGVEDVRRPSSRLWKTGLLSSIRRPIGRAPLSEPDMKGLQSAQQQLVLVRTRSPRGGTWRTVLVRPFDLAASACHDGSHFSCPAPAIRPMYRATQTKYFFNHARLPSIDRMKPFLASTGTERHPQLPDVPTVHEAGLEKYDLYAWICLGVSGNRWSSLLRPR